MRRAEVSAFALAAMRAVAAGGGPPGERARQWIDCVAALAPAAADSESPPPSSSSAASWPPALRRELLDLLVLTACADGLSRSRVAVVSRYDAALGGGHPWARNLRRLVDGKRRLAIADTFYRTPLFRGIVASMWRQERGRGLWLVVQNMILRRGDDRARAWRYRQLGLLREGTLGRQFWAHMTRNRLPMPGERGGTVEPVTMHDFMHVLTDYDTSPAGEVQIAAFTAGYHWQRPRGSVEDPFAWIFLVVMAFHLGIRVAHVGQTRDAFEPHSFVRAFLRGLGTRGDLTDHRMLLRHVDRPLDDVRQLLEVAR